MHYLFILLESMELCFCPSFYPTATPVGGESGEARSGETSKLSSLNSCVGLLSRKSSSWGRVFSGDSVSFWFFLISGGSFRNLRAIRGHAVNTNCFLLFFFCVCKKTKESLRQKKKRKQKPEEQFLSSLLFDDVEFVVVPQCTGHFLIGHVFSVLSTKRTSH